MKKNFTKRIHISDVKKSIKLLNINSNKVFKRENFKFFQHPHSNLAESPQLPCSIPTASLQHPRSIPAAFPQHSRSIPAVSPQHSFFSIPSASPQLKSFRSLVLKKDKDIFGKGGSRWAKGER